jgi:4-amino-4-deoxy-L-arabinose transferase and related glycosyltransferases of PMT family
LAKGPQPAGFFVFGVGVYILLRRRWEQIWGLALTAALPALVNIAWAAAVYQPRDQYNWLRYMRMDGHGSAANYLYERARFIIQLALEWLPTTLLLPFLATRRWRRSVPLLSLPVVFPLLCYACTGMALLLVWPGTGSRYAMPLTPAACVLAAFVAQELWRRRHWLGYLTSGMLGALVLYQLLLVSIGVPVFADQFGLSRATGQMISRAIQADPAPVYCLPPCDPTRLFYVEGPIVSLPIPDFPKVKAPAWLLTTRDVLPFFTRRRPTSTPASPSSGRRIPAPSRCISCRNPRRRSFGRTSWAILGPSKPVEEGPWPRNPTTSLSSAAAPAGWCWPPSSATGWAAAGGPRSPSSTMPSPISGSRCCMRWRSAPWGRITTT